MVLLAAVDPNEFSITEICVVVPPPFRVSVLLLMFALALVEELFRKIPRIVVGWFTPAPSLLLIVL